MTERSEIIRELDAKYGAYCEKKIKETWEAALDRAALVGYEACPCNLPSSECPVVVKIRALKFIR